LNQKSFQEGVEKRERENDVEVEVEIGLDVGFKLTMKTTDFDTKGMKSRKAAQIQSQIAVNSVPGKLPRNNLIALAHVVIDHYKMLNKYLVD
jgi:hypothetical protein